MLRHREFGEGELLLGKYRIARKIGEGGMAFVYQAVSRGVAGFERNVVIKVIKPELASSADLVRQFVQEASVGASLDHPNIVHVFDLGEHEGQLLMVLEYVPGKDLGALTRRVRKARRVLGPEMTTFVAVDVCKALEAAHSHVDARGAPSPVIHRDVSPQNILVSYEGVVKLADFGLARALGVARQTRQGIIKGKLSYMSPEQSRGREVDGRSDLFSLGTVLWEVLSGRRLFLAPDQVETIRRVRGAEVPPLTVVAPHVAPELAAIVHRALEREPGDRYQTATEMRKALVAYLRSARPVDPSALAGVIAAYFPAELQEPTTAETALSFDDESDLHGGEKEEDTEVDTVAPEMSPVPAGPVASHTMLMFDGALAAAVAQTAPAPDADAAPAAAPAAAPPPQEAPLDGGRTRLGAPALAPPGGPATPPPGFQGGRTRVGVPPASTVGHPAAPQAAAGPPAALPTAVGLPAGPQAAAARPAGPRAMAGQAEARPAGDFDGGATRLGLPAPGPLRGQPFAPARSLAPTPTPVPRQPPPPTHVEAPSAVLAPPPVSLEAAPPAPRKAEKARTKPKPRPRSRKDDADARNRSLIISLAVGIPLGIGMGALVFWLLTR